MEGGGWLAADLRVCPLPGSWLVRKAAYTRTRPSPFLCAMMALPPPAAKRLPCPT